MPKKGAVSIKAINGVVDIDDFEENVDDGDVDDYDEEDDGDVDDKDEEDDGDVDDYDEEDDEE